MAGQGPVGMPRALDGRGALVTGGGRGIGAAIARALAAAGARVVVSARSADQITGVARELREAAADAWALQVDVTDAAALEAMIADADDRLGGIDILVNNAGGASSAPLHRTTLEEWHRLLELNATSAFVATRAALPGMLTRAHGRIVNIASVAGLHGARYIAAYAASKHALVGLTRAVAAEVQGTGVTCNAVCPGYVDSPMTEQTIATISSRTGRTREETIAALLETGSQARLITPEEVAAAVLRLCADDAADVNGEAIVIEGNE
ncbi:MAG TPA: SDR family NAD(P)-dependent oxidoreductase [Longimicrobiales bacterium]|nr:SDR family NAD(P)-dependent oxidoreductase [Longimicrobiales bacterium]